MTRCFALEFGLAFRDRLPVGTCALLDQSLLGCRPEGGEACRGLPVSLLDEISNCPYTKTQ